ncbi:tetratricopeptide repeat protein [Chryseobacterium koreense]|uniref:tetratricopeptide repeat protein n=1 Tax=Chryseobacterium koreense TaxID=232216 RepID=UPI0026ECE036|nr:tetratricopeptide repeat protein [Chryseobacterium koreense]
MKRASFLFLFFFIGTVIFTAQENSDVLKKKANSLIYEQPDEAISIALELLKTEKKVDEIANLYMMISNAYIAKKNNDSSLFFNLKAKNLITKTALPATKIKILNSVAVQYQQMELYEKALKSLDEAQELTDKFSSRDQIYLYNSGFINNTRGIIYRNQANPDLALEKFKLAVQNFKKLQMDKKTAANLSITYHNMASCYMDLSQLKEAYSYFKEAEKYAKMFDDDILTAYNLKGQGEIFFQKNQHEESLKALYLAEKLAEPFGDLVLNGEIYNLLANNNLALNHIAQFQLYQRKSFEIQKTLEHDELKSFDRYLNAQNLEQKEITAKVKKHYSMYNWIAIILSMVLLGFIIKKVYHLKKNNRRRKKLTETFMKSIKGFEKSKM